MSEFHQSQEMEGSSPFAFLKDQTSVPVVVGTAGNRRPREIGPCPLKARAVER